MGALDGIKGRGEALRGTSDRIDTAIRGDSEGAEYVSVVGLIETPFQKTVSYVQTQRSWKDNFY
jgi:hypothetical protein